MDISNIYIHDGRLLRVIEDAECDTLTMEVELPANPDSDELVPRLLVFDNVHGYQVFDGPFDGIPAILDMKVAGEQGRWRQVRIDTNAGHRESCFAQESECLNTMRTKKLLPPPDGRSSSASRFICFGFAWLSLGR
jgi:hypothetical protein